MKCNIDGAAAKGTPDPAIFKDYRITYMGGFSSNLSISFALHDELVRVMIFIEIAFTRG